MRSARVKHARRLATRAFRAKTGEFLAEGPQAVREALAEPEVVIEVFATAEATARHGAWRDAHPVLPWHVVSGDVLAEIADAVQPQGIVARCHDVTVTLDALPAQARLVVVCAQIRDPGNLGAVIRCADAAGADAVIVAGDSVDPLNPKVVRSTAGSLFHLPVLLERDLVRAVETLQGAGLQVFGADGGGRLLDDAALDLSAPTAWVMGNEAHGLPTQVRELADEVVGVPMYGRAESLNLATAAAVCVYASAGAMHR
ncbi:TrmH family RNA methyltransferase [Aeromicrobium phragmitis]|uniref:TrmH family RNA methyltransferase n=1 Tax=Aeromicrobium phragmitis TaxID=2478914 RepID=UPI001FB7B592|nr:RNA methyltransferase [Aeromicrobium phragmitis]